MTMLQTESRGRTDDRQNFPEIELSYQVQIHFEENNYWVMAISMGAGGAFIETDAPLRGNSRFVLSLNSLESGCSTDARVAWRNDTGFGVVFLDPPEDFQEHLSVILCPCEEGAA